jgi:hypothetical protein
MKISFYISGRGKLAEKPKLYWRLSDNNFMEISYVYRPYVPLIVTKSFLVVETHGC